MIKKKVKLEFNLLYTLFIIYITALVSVTLFPIVYQADAVELRYGYEFNFIPLEGIISAFKDGGSAAIRNVGGNLLLLLPLGFIMPIISKHKNKFFVVLISGICTAVGIELLQYIIGCIIGYMYRAVDVDDVILNLSGCLVGFALFKIFEKPISKIFNP